MDARRRRRGDCVETQGPQTRVPYLPGMKSPVRRALSFSIPFSVAVLILGGSHEVGQRKAREDTVLCNRYFGPSPARFADAYTLGQVELCIDKRQTKRWGPWSAWRPLIPAPDED